MAFKINKKRFDLIIFIFLLGFIFFNVSNAIWSSKEKYLNFNYWNNFGELQKIYPRSQYVSKHPTAIIPDEIINSYAGGEYIRGSNPVLIGADTPPLGRYLIGLSAAIFNNENIVTLIFSISSLYLMFLVSTQIFQSKILSILPSFLFSFEPIFKNQIIYSPLLDIMQLTFLLGCFYFFNKGLNSKQSLKYFSLANLFLGFFISTKFFITGFTVIAAWYGLLFIRRKFNLVKKLSIALPISLLVLLATYIRLFFFDYTIKSFLGVQKYIFLYHKSQLILPLSVWPLLLFNKWYVWFGDKPVISDPQWAITWPLITVVSIACIAAYLLKKIPENKNLEILMAWFVFYVLFFSFGQISSRYFVILIPILYIISLYGVVSLYKVYRK